jgi:polysaccharide deacetylase family protein (PEP-CTERM system associated)
MPRFLGGRLAMRNILTVDVEEWYHGNDFDLPAERAGRLESRVELQTDTLLDLLDQTGARATFFVLGCVAEAHPDLVRRIHQRGHEVASHGHQHQLAYHLTPDQLERQIRSSVRALSGITGEPVAAFRAPSWSITERNLWAIDVVRACGLSADSSIFPMRTWMYGVKNARLDIHRIAEGLFEYPPAALRVGGLTLPVAGGVFFRLLPYAVTAAALRRINRAGRPAVVYLHPWELDPDHPRLPDLPSRRTWYHYWGLDAAPRKYARLLREFEFGSIRQHRETAG